MRNFEQQYRDLQQTMCVPSRRQFIMIVDTLQYMDSLAEQIGCKPPGFCEYAYMTTFHFKDHCGKCSVYLQHIAHSFDQMLDRKYRFAGEA